MIRTVPAEKRPVQAEKPTLDRLFEHIRYSNPFEVNRVVQVYGETADVSAIHEGAFRQLQELTTKTQRQYPGVGAVLWGEPGIGKSHLLARLGQWAGKDNQNALFFYLANLHAEPEALPRSLLRCVISILTHGRADQFHQTPLYRLVLAAVRRALKADGTKKFTIQEAAASFRQLVDGLCQADPSRAALVDRAVYDVLFRFYYSATGAWKGKDDGGTGLAVRWLSGDYLERDEARLLGLPVGPRAEVALGDDRQIRNVLIALAQLASWVQKPLLLCFDQVDNLEPEQFGSLARFLHALLDSTGNLLVITSGLQEVLLQWKQDRVVPGSAWDRLLQYQVQVTRISVAETRLILQTRLQPFQEAFRSLTPVWQHVEKNLLFPLGPSWETEFLSDRIEIRPRDAINWAREGWQREQEYLLKVGGETWLKSWPHASTPASQPAPDINKLIDDQVGRKLHERLQQLLLEPHQLPPDENNLAGLLQALLQRCASTQQFPTLIGVDPVKPPRHGPLPAYQMVVRQRRADGKDYRSGLLCLVTGDKQTMARALQRLAKEKQRSDCLVLVTEERRPLEPAHKGKEHLDALKEHHRDHFQQVQLTFQQYSDLDALQHVVGLARSGDLEIALPGGKTQRVTEEQVIESHLRQARYLAHPLLKLLLSGEAAVPAAPNPKLDPVVNIKRAWTPDEKDMREFIMGRLAITMGMSSHELSVSYRAYLKTKTVDWETNVCKEKLEQVARKLHQEGQINATPQDDYLVLLMR